MKNISAWAIRHPVTPVVLFVVLFFLGIVAFIRLPIDLNPDVTYPVVNVFISQPGAAPTEIETQIAQKVEGSISGIGNVRNITTYIVEGSVNIGLEFQIGTPVDRAVTDVRDAVAKVRNDLPQGIMEPLVQRVNVDDDAISFYAATTTTLTPQELSWFVDNTITKRLLAVPGVAQVSRNGGVDREIRVELDPARLQALGLTAVGCQRAIARAQSRCPRRPGPGGRRRTGDSRAGRRQNGGGSGGNADHRSAAGSSFRLREIADVHDGIAEVRTIARLNGRPATTFGVFKAKGASDVSVAKAVQAELDKIQVETPAVHMTPIFTTVDHTLRTYHSSIERPDRGLDPGGCRRLAVSAQLARDGHFCACDSVVGDADFRLHVMDGLHAQQSRCSGCPWSPVCWSTMPSSKSKTSCATCAWARAAIRRRSMRPMRSDSRWSRPPSPSLRYFCR